MEGLNNAGTLKRQFLVVLNDNGMSIAKPQGAMAGYFDRIRVSHRYTGFKKKSHRILERFPFVGRKLESLYHRSTEALKAILKSEHLFEHFGLTCVGPVDGHNLDHLIPMLSEIKLLDRPVLLHAKTIKGKGFDFSSPATRPRSTAPSRSSSTAAGSRSSPAGVRLPAPTPTR